MTDGPVETSREFFEAYGAGEVETVRSLLDPDAVSFITNGEGGVDRVEGRDGFMDRLPDLEGAEMSISINQVAGIDEVRAMAMIEVRAKRAGRALHNFAAFLVLLGRSDHRTLDGRRQAGRE